VSGKRQLGEMSARGGTERVAKGELKGKMVVRKKNNQAGVAKRK